MLLLVGRHVHITVEVFARLKDVMVAVPHSLGRQVQKALPSSPELPHGMCQPKLGARGIGQRLDCIVGLAVGLQQVQQNLASQGEMEHFAWREVACNESSCGKCLHHNCCYW